MSVGIEIKFFNGLAHTFGGVRFHLLRVVNGARDGRRRNPGSLRDLFDVHVKSRLGASGGRNHSSNEPMPGKSSSQRRRWFLIPATSLQEPSTVRQYVIVYRNGTHG